MPETETRRKDIPRWYTRIAPGESVWVNNIELRLLKIAEKDCLVAKIEGPIREDLTLTYHNIQVMPEYQAKLTRKGNKIQFIINAPASVKIETSMQRRANRKK